MKNTYTVIENGVGPIHENYSLPEAREFMSCMVKDRKFKVAFELIDNRYESTVIQSSFYPSGMVDCFLMWDTFSNPL